jgi:type II secretory pathway pseudopilin PulG
MRFFVKRCKGEEGYSLAELMISVIILSALVFATFQVLNANIEGGRTFAAKSEIAEDLRSTLDTMVTQLRAANVFVDAQSDDVSFQGYLTGGAVMQTARFYLSGTDLMYTCADVGISDSLISSDITVLNMTYYDSTGTLLPSPNDSLESIAEMRIDITVGTNEDLGNSATTTVKVRI